MAKSAKKLLIFNRDVYQWKRLVTRLAPLDNVNLKEFLNKFWYI
ncbi:hypothetical protein SAMN02744775_03580 [Enterobacter sp. CC120223-11]|nr:hypothetical protein SAMN02744775_03580 [Enterobacter sp. CC120223-11]